MQRLMQELVEGQRASLGNSAMALQNLAALAPSRAPIRTAFLVHNFEAWGALREVHRRMQADPRFAPVVFSVPRRFPGARRFGNEATTSAHLNADGVAHVRLNDPVAVNDLDRIKAFGIEALFRQSHWQADLPPAFSSWNLNFARQYYVPYAIGSLSSEGGGRVKHTPRDICARQFLASPLVAKVMGESDRLGGVRNSVSGHPKVFDLLSTAPHWPIESGNTTRVIWSGHHSIGTKWSNFGVFLQVHEAMLALARRRHDVDFLFSPHPALVTKLAALTGDNRRSVDAFFAQWNALANTGTLENGRYQEAFHASDLLVVDGLSFLIEFQLLAKPIIRLTRPDNAPFNAFGRLVAKGTHDLPAAEIDSLEAMIDGLLDGTIPHKKSAQQAVYDELTGERDPAGHILEAVHSDLRGSTDGARPGA